MGDIDTQEATYIWTVADDVKDLKQELTNTDKIINLIIRDWENEYRSRNEEDFNRVLKNGFKNWKEEIKKVIL